MRSGNSPDKAVGARSPERISQATTDEPPGYFRFLNEVKERIRAARVKAVMSANRELIELYWHIGKGIVERQRRAGWGRSVVERLSRDLWAEFPDSTGLSVQNLWKMRAFYLAWTENAANLSQAVRELDVARAKDWILFRGLKVGYLYILGQAPKYLKRQSIST